MSRYLYPGAKALASLDFAGQPSNDDTLVVDDRTYTFKTTLTGANFEIEIGADADETASNTVTAINASGQEPSSGIVAVIDDVDASTVRLYGNSIGEKANATIDASGATNVTASGNMAGGREKEIIVRQAIDYTITANDVTANQARIRTGMTSPKLYSVLWLNSSGVQRHDIDSVVSILNDDVKIVFSGTTDPVAGDIVRLVVEDV